MHACSRRSVSRQGIAREEAVNYEELAEKHRLYEIDKLIYYKDIDLRATLICQVVVND